MNFIERTQVMSRNEFYYLIQKIMSFLLENSAAEQGCSCPTDSVVNGRATARASAKRCGDGSSQCRFCDVNLSDMVALFVNQFTRKSVCLPRTK